MALTERLALLITLDADKAVKGLESVGRSADRNLSRTESKLDKAGQKFQKVGAGMLAGAGLAAAGLFKAGQSAADLEQAVGGTEAVFKDASGYIDKYAKTAADKMGMSERAFREATTAIGGQLKGLGFGLDESAEKSVELARLANDLAATYGGTATEAVQALGAAFRGEADPAERFNLFLNQNRVNAKAVAMGLAETTSEVDAHAKAQATLALVMEQSVDAQGQAAREAGTAAGQMQRATANLEDFKASLGQSVAPIMANVAGGLADLAGGFSSADEATDGLLSKLATFGTLGLGAAGGLSFVIGKAIELRDSIKDLPSRIGNLASSLGKFKGPAAIAAGGVGLFGLAMFKASQDAEELRAAAKELAEEAERTGKSLEEVALEKLARTFAESDRVTEAMDDLSVSFKDLRDPLQGSADDFDQWATALRSAAGGNTVLRSEADLLIARVRELRGQLGEAEQVTDRTAEAHEALGIKTTEAADASSGLTEKVDEQKEALEGLLDATLAMFDANLGYRNSVDDVEDKLADLVELQKEGKKGTEEYEDALRTAEGAIIDQAAAAVRLFEDTAKANGQTLTAAQRAGIFKTELEKLGAGLAPGSPLRVQLEAYIAQLGRIPAEKTTTVNLRLGNTITGFKGDQLIAGTRASGGPVSAGQTYLVGEQGPELLHMGSSGGFVSPNSSLTSGGNTINITVSALDPGAAARAVMDALKSAGIRGVAA